jgi:DNA (cytosine-5)-methyltransferase 1
VLDAQYFGLAQRRRRVFVVAGAGDRGDPVQVLLERDGLRRDSPPSRQTRQDTAGPAACRAFGGNNTSGPIDVATALNACASASGRMDFETETFVTHSLRGEGFDASEDGTGRGTPLVPVAFDCKASTPVAAGAIAPTLRAMNAIGRDNAGGQLAVHHHLGVRRLTPRECERLQGFPDDYTRIPWRRKAAEDCPDGPRYRALGNSMAVPVMHWIGSRIQAAGNR